MRPAASINPVDKASFLSYGSNIIDNVKSIIMRIHAGRLERIGLRFQLRPNKAEIPIYGGTETYLPQRLRGTKDIIFKELKELRCHKLRQSLNF